MTFGSLGVQSFVNSGADVSGLDAQLLNSLDSPHVNPGSIRRCCELVDACLASNRWAMQPCNRCLVRW